MDEPESGPRFGRHLPGLLLALAFLALGWATLPSYGLTWDEGLGDLYFGDRYWEYFKSGCDEKYLDNERAAIDYYAEPGQVDFFESPYRTRPEHFWPVANIVCSMFGELLDRRLGVFDPVDARHAGVVFLGALTLLAVWVFTRNAFGPTEAILAVVFLGIHPHFFGHAHNDIKDIGECAFYAWTLVAFWHAMSRKSTAWLLLSGVLFGLALGTKLNAAFIPATLVIWLLLRVVLRRRRPRLDFRPFLAVGLVALIGVPIFVLSWPWLWADPLDRLRFHLETFVRVAGKGPDHWQIYPFRQALIGTPPAIVAAFALGCGAIFASPENRRRWSTVLFVLSWLIVPFVRGTLPEHFNYDGMRRYIEFLPAAAILAGAGVAWLLTFLPHDLHGRARRLACAAVALLFVAPPVWEDVRIHPNQTSYLNVLRGASRPEDHWGNSYRAGCRWLNEHAEPSSRVLVPLAEWTVHLPASIWLRPDLSVLEIGKEAAHVPTTYVLLLNRPNRVAREAPNLDRIGTRVHEIRVDDHPILIVYRLESDWSPPRKRVEGAGGC